MDKSLSALFLDGIGADVYRSAVSVIDKYCMRDKLNIPRGERYEMCRSIHAEANAIIAASREEMIGATMYLSGLNAQTGELEPSVDSCMMCKRMIINSGIETVVVRLADGSYRVSRVEDWVTVDDSLSGKFGY